MDRSKSEAPKKRWEWLPAAMPGVAALVAEKRKLYGDQHVNECWSRGVLKGEAGWFFAREGTLAVGTPWQGDPVMENFAALHVTKTQALVIMREPGGAADGND